MRSMRHIQKTRRTGRLAVICLGLFLGTAGVLSAQNTDNTLYFVQVSDTHWGFNNPKVNPDFAGTLKKGISEINALQGQPDCLDL